MDSQRKPQSLYPQIIESNPEKHSPFLSDLNSNPSRTSLYPSVDNRDLENLFPDANAAAPSLPQPVEETFLRIPGAILHLIDRDKSVELAVGEFTIVRLRQGERLEAVLVRVGSGDEDSAVQWPLARDEVAVKLDGSHYFFLLHVPKTGEDDEPEGVLNYGITFASKGQEGLLRELDGVLETYSSFSVQKVAGKDESELLDGSVAKEVTPAEAMAAGSKREMMERSSAAYWTTLAPNVEDYGGSVAKAIARGSGQLIKGILWCGDVTIDRLKNGEEMMKRKTKPCLQPTEISKDALKRVKRVKRVAKMSEKVVTGVLDGVIKVSEFITGTIVNSKAGKKFFGLPPMEIALATLDGVDKISDAVEVVGRKVLQTSSVVTTGVVSHRYVESNLFELHLSLNLVYGLLQIWRASCRDHT